MKAFRSVKQTAWRLVFAYFKPQSWLECRGDFPLRYAAVLLGGRLFDRLSGNFPLHWNGRNVIYLRYDIGEMLKEG